MTQQERTGNGSQTIHHEVDAERQFLMHPQDNDLFMRNGRQIINDCRLSIGLEVWLDEMKSLCRFINGWCTERPGKLVKCQAKFAYGRVVFYFMPTSEVFDFGLADEITELQLLVRSRFNVGLTEMHQVPEDEIDRFIEADAVVPIYGEAPAAHQSVEA